MYDHLVFYTLFITCNVNHTAHIYESPTYLNLLKILYHINSQKLHFQAVKTTNVFYWNERETQPPYRFTSWLNEKLKNWKEKKKNTKTVESGGRREGEIKWEKRPAREGKDATTLPWLPYFLLTAEYEQWNQEG